MNLAAWVVVFRGKLGYVDHIVGLEFREAFEAQQKYNFCVQCMHKCSFVFWWIAGIAVYLRSASHSMLIPAAIDV